MTCRPCKCSVDGCDFQVQGRGMCIKHYNRFMRYGDANHPVRAIRKPGTGGRHSVNGYFCISSDGVRKLRHVLIAEKALGKSLPKGAEVHHFDENKFNDDPSNLVICPDHAYHMLLHRRQRALDACGHADWVKCWVCLKWDDPINMYVNRRQAQHLPCLNEKRRLAKCTTAQC